MIGFALDWGEGVLWFSGDTVLYDGVKEVAQRLDVDVAVLHVGGVQFPVTGPARYTMTGHDAVELTKLIKPRIAIPIHYEGWKHFVRRQARRRARDRRRAGRHAGALPLARHRGASSAIERGSGFAGPRRRLRLRPGQAAAGARARRR